MTLLVRVWLSLVAALAIALALRPLGDPDVWFHLAAGRLMLATGGWPAGNTFAFTAPDHPWIDLHWVFQLALHGAWQLGGANGCIALVAALVLTTVGITYATAARLAPGIVVVPVLVVALTIASGRFVPRPELVSFVLVAAYLWLLERRPLGRLVYLLVPLQVLWVNSHGIFAVGLAVIGCYWLGATLALLPLPRGWREASGRTPDEWRHLTMAFALASLGCLVNPYGVDGLRLPLQLLTRVSGGSVFSMRIAEFLPPFAFGYGSALTWLWATYLAAVGLSFLLVARRCHLGRLLTVAAFGVLSTRALRNMALFAWIAAPILAGNLGAFLAQRKTAPAPRPRRRRDAPPAPEGRGRSLAAGAVTLALVLFLAAVVTNRFSRFVGTRKQLGVGVSPSVSEGVFVFARDAGITGRPFNCLILGGLLAWQRFPEEQVFVDGRLEAYPEEFFESYFRILDTPEKAWGEAASRYGFDYAVLYHGSVDRYPLARYLAAGHGWQLVYYDDTAALFLPVDEPHRAMRERAERAFAGIRARRIQEPLPAAPGLLRRLLVVPVEDVRRQTSYGDFLRFLGLYPEAVQAYQHARTFAPGDRDIRLVLGGAYWFDNRRDDALREWREILRRDPDFEPARRAIAEATKSGGQAR